LPEISVESSSAPEVNKSNSFHQNEVEPKIGNQEKDQQSQSKSVSEEKTRVIHPFNIQSTQKSTPATQM